MNRKLSCGHSLKDNGNIIEYMGILIDHIKECEKAQEILIEARKKHDPLSDLVDVTNGSDDV